MDADPVNPSIVEINEFIRGALLSGLVMNDNFGVYMILNTYNQKIYIGSTTNLRKRRNTHVKDLRDKKHVCRHLQNSFDAYGESFFKFQCIEYCKTKNELINREQYWLDKFWDSDRLFNGYRQAYRVFGKDHPLFGTHRSEEVKNKIREKRKNQIIKHTEETKNKIRAKSLLHRHSEYSKKKMSSTKLSRRKKISEDIFNKIINDYEGGKPLCYLRDTYKYSTERIKRDFLNHGITLHRPQFKHIDNSQLKNIVHDYNKGMSITGLNKRYGHSYEVLKKNLINQGVIIRGHLKILKKDEVDLIAADYNKGFSLHKLHEKYFLSYEVIKRNLADRGIDIRLQAKRNLAECGTAIRHQSKEKELTAVSVMRKCLIPLNEETIEEYNSGSSLMSLSREYHKSPEVIKEFLIKHGIKIRSLTEQFKFRKAIKKFDGCIVSDSTCSTGRTGRFCYKHWNQYHAGIIDFFGNKLRGLKNRKRYFECMAKNAGTGKCSEKLVGRFCTKHKNQYDKKIIDKNGEKLRDLRKWAVRFPECIAKNSGTGVCNGGKNGRFCSLHYDHYRDGIIDKNGNKLRDLNYGFEFPECIAKNAGTGKCTKHNCGRFCKRHYYQYSVGIIDHEGRKLKEPSHEKGLECLAVNAGTGICSGLRAGRFCQRHYHQYKTGVIDTDGKKLKEPFPFFRGGQRG